jgi:hypothetical protein
MLDKVFEEGGQLKCQTVLKDLPTRLQIIQFRICVLDGSTIVSPDDHTQNVIVGVFWRRNSHSIWSLARIKRTSVECDTMEDDESGI